MRGRFFDQLKRFLAAIWDDNERRKAGGSETRPYRRANDDGKRRLKQILRCVLDDGPTFTEKRGGWVRTRKAEQSRPIGPPEGGRYEC